MAELSTGRKGYVSQDVRVWDMVEGSLGLQNFSGRQLLSSKPQRRATLFDAADAACMMWYDDHLLSDCGSHAWGPCMWGYSRTVLTWTMSLAQPLGAGGRCNELV